MCHVQIAIHLFLCSFVQCVQVNQLSVPRMTRYENQHHYKHHAAVARVMVQILLSMVDDDIIPYSLTGAAGGLTNTLWQTSEQLETCSKSMQDLGR